jgi:hypothetical protein
MTWDGFKKRRVLKMKRRKENEIRKIFRVKFYKMILTIIPSKKY